MFTKNIQTPALATPVADQYFKDFPCEGSFSRDQSFIAAIRALVPPRVQPGQGVRLSLRECTLRDNDFSGVEDAIAVRAVIGGLDKNDNLVLVNLSSRPDDNEKMIKLLDKAFISVNPTFTELDVLKKFFAENMDARFYIDAERHVTVIVVNRMTHSRYHLLQSVIPRYLPWYFTKEKPLDEMEKALCAAALKRESEPFEELLERFANERYDMRSITIKALIGDFERQSRKAQIENATNRYEEAIRRIEENNDALRRLIEEKDEAMIRLEGIRAIVNGAGDSSELMEYCISNKRMKVVETKDSHIRFILRGYLNIFDPEIFEVSFRNNDSILYHGYSADNSDFRRTDARKKLLNAIFGPDELIKIRTCGFFDLDIRGHVSSARHYDFAAEYEDALPNPHLHYHNCFGNQERYIRAALEKGDVPAAIEQCASCVGSINLGESPTMDKFLHDLFSSSKKFLELPDGTVVSPSEALEWVKNNEKKK